MNGSQWNENHDHPFNITVKSFFFFNGILQYLL